MATVTKPTAKYQPPDWFTNSYAITANSERQQAASEQVRQETRQLRNETSVQQRWDQHDNETRLADRIDAIRKWKEILKRTHDQLDEEIEKLDIEKDEAEKKLEALNIPKDCINECLIVRDGRKNIDNVEDEPEHMLKKEQEIIVKVRDRLQQKIDEALEQHGRLSEARAQILSDIEDKVDAMTIDINQLHLNEKSASISYKPNPTRVPKGSTTPKQWEDYSRYNQQRALAEMEHSMRLREVIHQVIHSVDNDLAAQNRDTNFAFRKRMQETKKAIDELKWQKENIEREIAEMQRDLDNLEASIRNKIPSEKLAQTRLENRTQRPGVELCRDQVQYGLTDEVMHLKVSKNALLEKQRQARHNLDALEKNLNTINDDLDLKCNSLDLDTKCQATRERMAAKPQTQQQKNLLSVGVTREASKVLA